MSELLTRIPLNACTPGRALTSECRVRKMKRPESHVPLMIGRSISHFRVIEKLGPRTGRFCREQLSRYQARYNNAA